MGTFPICELDHKISFIKKQAVRFCENFAKFPLKHTACNAAGLELFSKL